MLKEVHIRLCDEHQGISKLYNQLISIGYYWPTIEADIASFTQRCQACQFSKNRIHAPIVELHTLALPHMGF